MCTLSNIPTHSRVLCPGHSQILSCSHEAKMRSFVTDRKVWTWFVQYVKWSQFRMSIATDSFHMFSNFSPWGCEVKSGTGLGTRLVTNPIPNNDIHQCTKNPSLCFSLLEYLASFPGSCAWVKKKSLVHAFVHASSPKISGNFGNFHKIYSATLTSVRHADFSHVKDACHPLTMLCMDDDKGAVCGTNSFVLFSQLLTHWRFQTWASLGIAQVKFWSIVVIAYRNL